MDEISKKLAENSEGVLEEAYKDLVSPTMKPIGIMLSLLPRTIRLGLSKWEKWIVNSEESLKLTAEALKEKVEKIPEDKQCEPEPYVAVPAIQQIAYCFDSTELREMYANLLAASMNTDTKWKVHPSFVDIIKQLTPDEAKLLQSFPRSSSVYLPVADLVIKMGKGKGERTVARNIVRPQLYEICSEGNNMSGYLENLARLKLICIPEDMHLVDNSHYSEIENSSLVQNLENLKLQEGEEYEIKKKLLYVTDFGISFAKCCID